MIDEPELIEFRPDQRADVVARMAEIERDGNGWINFQPGVDPDYEPVTQTALGGLVSGRGPQFTLATWAPGERRRRKVEPATIGLQHAAGPKAAYRLGELGIPVPSDWHVVADHSRRGLVIAVPDQTDPDRVLDWLLKAGGALTPQMPLTGMWRASIYRTR